MEKQIPVLVTLTSPTAAGKSYLLNYIRDQGYPCLVSTTTRQPRAGEKEGVDYYFIDTAESLRLEGNNQFAELAIYRGVRYGVTKEEFHNKLNKGVAFLIVEPSGIDHYVKPALDVGALHLKYYVHTDPAVRLERFKGRVQADIMKTMKKRTNGNTVEEMLKAEEVLKTVMSHMDRLVAMTTVEMQWGTATHWTRTLMGDKPPAENLKIIMRDVAVARNHQEEVNLHNDQFNLMGCGG